MKIDFLQVFTTVPDRETADNLANELVFKSRLAACVQITGEIKSYYTWQNKECRTAEYFCIIKTTGKLFPRVEQKIKSLHPYQVPEIVAVPLAAVSDDYRQWMETVIHDKES